MRLLEAERWGEGTLGAALECVRRLGIAGLLSGVGSSRSMVAVPAGLTCSESPQASRGLLQPDETG